MKKKSLKIGVIAALGAVAATQACNQKPGNRQGAEGQTISQDSITLENRLAKLARTPYKGKLSMGAMCYDISVPVYAAYICPTCGDSIRERYDSWQIGTIESIRMLVAQIAQKGYDVVLDRSEFCPACSGRRIENPELIFKMRFSRGADYHIARSNLVYEYQCVLAFVEGRESYMSDQDFENALHDNINIIQKMTGLGSKLDIQGQRHEK